MVVLKRNSTCVTRVSAVSYKGNSTELNGQIIRIRPLHLYLIVHCNFDIQDTLAAGSTLGPLDFFIKI